MQTVIWNLVVTQTSMSLWDETASNRRFTVTLSDPVVGNRQEKPSVAGLDLTPAQAQAIPPGTPVTVTFTF